jgi:outer membrane immunogenic protein
MRRLLVALGLIVSISSAFAQEYEIPTLRGSDSFVPDAPGPLYRPRWSGFYAGGQLGFGVASMDFGGATQDLVAHELRELALENEVHPSGWQVLGKAETASASYGGFLGYNIGWESLILGVELNYSRSNFSTDGSISPLRRVVPAGGNIYDLTINGSASMRITDYGTLRARAGYEVGNFLPFAMIGAAFGRANLARSASASGQENPAAICPSAGPPPCTPFFFTESAGKTGAFIYGWMLGGGLEIMVMPQVFLRGEYEYVAFSAIWGIKANIQTVRLGAGYKF